MIYDTLKLQDIPLLVQPMVQRDFYIVLSIILLCVFAISKVVFPKLFVESISMDKLFGFRVKEDLGSTIRPFSTEHIYFTALFGYNLAFVTNPQSAAIEMLTDADKSDWLQRG